MRALRLAAPLDSLGAGFAQDACGGVCAGILLLLAAVVVPFAGCRGRRAAPDASPAAGEAAPGGAPHGRLVLLAFDGMDLGALERWTDEGRLPNFARLRAVGEFSRLETTEPPTAEAAWTALVTGLGPAESGVIGPARIDHRTRTTLPGAVELDMSRAPPRAATRRSGEAFWTELARGGVRVRVLWAPFELPPERIESGEVLAGLGVPDLGGSAGRSTLLGASFPEGVAGGGPIGRVRLLPSAVGWAAALPGPPEAGGGHARTSVPVEVRRSADASRMAVALPDAEAELPLGAWSPRMPVRFRSGDLHIDGLARFLLLDSSDLPLVLAAPLELDPAAPWFPICEPPDWAGELAARYGRVPTLGTPGDLAALAAGALPEEAYLEDLAEDLAARSRIILGELDRGGFDFFAAFVPFVERVTLGLHRLADPSHPAWDEARSLAPAPGFGGVRLRDAELAAYAFVDDLVGRVADRLGPDDVLLVLSDHAPGAWRRSAHLGAWLRREGLLVLHERDAFAGAAESQTLPGLDDVDWSRTQAYALGGPYIQLNLEGREEGGAVEPGERYDGVVERMVTKLEGWVDEGAGGTAVVRRVLVRGRELRGRREDELPDLVVVFADGYREGEETIVGEIDDEVLGPNRSVIGADYGSGDASERRGFLYSTRPLVRGNPSIGDLGASALGFFGVAGEGHGMGMDFWR
ncbi:MAG: alkaline phosphatase family protein [Deltaproteobacteria bacterium]|nr:alkaline phosphatase family protein [Deltaproteobacteria bacterium]